MEKPTTIEIIADKTMVYTRVVNSILASLPANYEHYEDVFELKELTEQIDISLRNKISIGS